MDKKNIISLISFIVSLILIFVFVFPLYSSVKIMRLESSQKHEEIEKLKELLAKVEKIKSNYQNVAEEIEKVFLALPEEKDVPELLVQFEKLAVSNGLLLESIKFGEISKKKESDSSSRSKKILSIFPNSIVELKITGSYSAFKNYLKALEKNVRSMDVYSIKFSSSIKKYNLFSDLGIFEFDLGVNVYYQ